jgi:hypothetical protein
MDRVVRIMGVLDECDATERLEVTLAVLTNLFALFLPYEEACQRDDDVERMFKLVRHNLAAADRFGHDRVH